MCFGFGFWRRQMGWWVALGFGGRAALGAALPDSSASIPPAPPRVLYYFDARPWRDYDRSVLDAVQWQWDRLHLLAALQGLVNRHTARFYLLYCREFGVDTDAFWLDWLENEDPWRDGAKRSELPDLRAVLESFAADFHGLVVYDPAVPATSNVASTAAGCDQLLPVRYDRRAGSLYQFLIEDLGLPVRLWLVERDGSPKFTARGVIPDIEHPTSGSPRIDAYRWAIERYIRSGKCDPAFAAYTVDADWIPRAAHGPVDMHTLTNHDYFIAHRAFFFDLSPWADEPPTGDPAQPLGADYRTLCDIFGALNAAGEGEFIKVGGFVPWPYKYTTFGSGGGNHDPVPTEWELARLVSQFNGYLEADAAGLGALANASFFQHYPLRDQYPQPASIPDESQWEAKGYWQPDNGVAPLLFLGHYVGDYDAPSWLYKAVPAFYDDPARGRVPLALAFNPNLADRVPQAMAYARLQATNRDWFVAGDSGAGYLNPRALTERPDSKLPPALLAWGKHCRRRYRQWDLSITGFVLDGAAGASTEREFAVYSEFSPDGLGTHFERGPSIHHGVPTCPEVDLPHNLDHAVATILERSQFDGNRPAFIWARSILRPPQWYLELNRRLESAVSEGKLATVDPYTFFGLIAKSLEAGSP